MENVVVDSSSIEVDRRKRRAKTDRIDAGKLLTMLTRYQRGERLSWRVVRVPGEEEEDGRYLHRELEVLKKERVMHRNRMKGLLIQQGIALKNPSSRRLLVELETLKTWDGKPLPPGLQGPDCEGVWQVKGGGRADICLEKRKTGPPGAGRQSVGKKGGAINESSGDWGGELLEVCHGVFWLAGV